MSNRLYEAAKHVLTLATDNQHSLREQGEAFDELQAAVDEVDAARKRPRTKAKTAAVKKTTAAPKRRSIRRRKP